MPVDKQAFLKALILTAAVYVAKEHLCCRFFKSVQHSIHHLRHWHQHRQHHQPNGHSSGIITATASTSDGPNSHLRRPRQQQSQQPIQGHLEVEKGDNEENDLSPVTMTVSRQVHWIGDDIVTPVIEFPFDDSEHCRHTLDEHGNYHCFYQPGDVVSMDYTLLQQHDQHHPQQPSNDNDNEIESANDSISTSISHENAFVVVSVVLDDTTSWSFQCNLCGETCNLEGMPHGLQLSLDTPADCDGIISDPQSRKGSLSLVLGEDDELMPLLNVKGTVDVYTQPDELLAQMEWNVTTVA